MGRTLAPAPRRAHRFGEPCLDTMRHYQRLSIFAELFLLDWRKGSALTLLRVPWPSVSQKLGLTIYTGADDGQGASYTRSACSFLPDVLMTPSEMS